MGFSGLLDRYRMYENHIQPILKLTSVLIGDVIKVAKNSKLLFFLCFFAWDHFLNGHNFFIKQDSDMGFSGLLELDKMYEIHLPTILKLTSALMGVVMNVAEKLKFSKKILNPDKVCSEWHETDCASINFFFFQNFLFWTCHFLKIWLFSLWNTFERPYIFSKARFWYGLFRIARPLYDIWKSYTTYFETYFRIDRWRHQSGWKLKITDFLLGFFRLGPLFERPQLFY